MSLPYSPVPKSSPSGTRLYCRGGHFGSRVRAGPARGRPKAVFLLLACCTQEEDAGPGTVVPAGRYRFSAEVSSENLTTDQGPFFRIFSPANPARLHAESAPILGTVGKHRITVEFTVRSEERRVGKECRCRWSPY